jgi:hypothetical protein
MKLFNAKHADRSDCDESDFNIVIELDESEMSQVGGGKAASSDLIIMRVQDKTSPLLSLS